MLDSLAEGIVACDAEGRLVLFNQATVQFHGLPASALPASEWAEHYDLFDADGRTPLTMDEIPLFRALRGEVVRDVPLVIAPAMGAVRHVLCSGRQIHDDNGVLLGAVVAMHDITEQLAAEARARDAAVERAHTERLQQLHHASLRLLGATSIDEVGAELVEIARSMTGASACDLTIGDKVSVQLGESPPSTPPVAVSYTHLTLPTIYSV